MTWKDITIEKYVNVMRYLQQSDADTLSREIKLQSLLFGKNEKEIERLRASEFIENTKQLSFLNTKPEGKLHYEFKIGKQRFRAALTFADMKASQFIDFSAVSKEHNGIEAIYNMHKLIACMCSRRKRGIYIDKTGLHFSEYVYDGYDKYCDLFFKQMTLDIAYPYFTFFLKTYIALPKAITTSLRLELKRETRKRKNGTITALMNTGGG